MVALQPFMENDFAPLISENLDARFLLQWAGPKYICPLNAVQLRETLSRTEGKQPSFQFFKAVLANTSETLGNVQLMNIDYAVGTCTLGRVLIYAKHRGHGLGKPMVREAVKIAFEDLGLKEVVLSVFAFNSSAIAVYQNLGFVEFEFLKNAHKFQDENWPVLRMRLNKVK